MRVILDDEKRWVAALDVVAVIADTLPYTALLTVAGLFLSLVIGIPIGIIAALRRNSLWDHALSAFALLGLSMPVAVGTSLLVIGINSVTALAFRLDQGLDLDWTVIGLFTVSAVLGGLAGNRVVSRVNPARLGQAFAILLVAVAVYTAARSVPRLF